MENIQLKSKRSCFLVITRKLLTGSFGLLWPPTVTSEACEVQTTKSSNMKMAPLLSVHQSSLKLDSGITDI